MSSGSPIPVQTRGCQQCRSTMQQQLLDRLRPLVALRVQAAASSSFAVAWLRANTTHGSTTQLLRPALLWPALLRPTLLRPTLLRLRLLRPMLLRLTPLRPTLLRPTLLPQTLLRPTIHRQTLVALRVQALVHEVGCRWLVVHRHLVAHRRVCRRAMGACATDRSEALAQAVILECQECLCPHNGRAVGDADRGCRS